GRRMEQGSSFCVRRGDRRAGYGLGIQLEHSAHWPAAVAQGARELQTVSSASGPSELEPGSGHRADQEGNDEPKPLTWRAHFDDGGRLAMGARRPQAVSDLKEIAMLGDCKSLIGSGAVRYLIGN